MTVVELALSTWSLHSSLGPLHLSRRGPGGGKVPFDVELPGAARTLELLDVPRQARDRLGVEMVEICQMHVPSRDPEYLGKLKRALSEAGARAIGMPIDVGNISVADAAHRADDLAEIEGWIDVAADLGARVVRVNASAPMAQEPLGPLEATVAAYERLCDRAAGRGLQMTVENHGGITTDPETVVRIVEAVGPDRLRVCLDVGNFPPVMGLRGDPPADLDVGPLHAGINRIAPYAAIVHAKTTHFDEAGRHLGWDPAAALRVVRDAGYGGPVSIEYGGGRDEWANARRTREIVERVFG